MFSTLVFAEMCALLWICDQDSIECEMLICVSVGVTLEKLSQQRLRWFGIGHIYYALYQLLSISLDTRYI